MKTTKMFISIKFIKVHLNSVKEFQGFELGEKDNVAKVQTFFL